MASWGRRMIALTPRHLGRYRTIIEVLVRHGFGAVLTQLDLDERLGLQRLLHTRKKEPDSPDVTPAERLRLALEELGPTFVKLGQVLSTRHDLLPHSFIIELIRLQDNVCPVPWADIQQSIETELGQKIEDCFAQTNPLPLASASLGQVHAATLFDGQEVVIKVQRPNIEPLINLDLDILHNLAWLAQEQTPLGQIYNFIDMAEDFAAALHTELDYLSEARNAERFRANFLREKHLHVPDIIRACSTRRILVMERLHGIKLDHIKTLDEAGYDRPRIARHCARIIVKEILEDGFFHADPHPGNLVVMPGEILGVMDFGTMGYLDSHDRADLVRLYVFMVQMDIPSLVEEFIRMGLAGTHVDRGALERDVRRLLKKYHGVPLSEVQFGDVLEGIMTISFRHRLHLSSDLWLLIKTLTMMEGIGRQLDPQFDLIAESEPHVQRFKHHLWFTSEWGPATVDLANLVMRFPRQASRLLDKAERNQLGIQIHLPELPQATDRLDKIANRLAVSILIAALIMALASLLPVLDLAWPWGWVTWVVVIVFGGVSLLGLWLAWNIWQSGR